MCPLRAIFCVVIACAGCSAGEDAAALLARAAALQADGLPTEAARLLESSLESVRPGDRGRVQLRMAWLFHLGGLDVRALRAANEAIAAGGTDPDLYFLKGDAERELRVPGARETLEKLLALKPDHAPGKLSLARILLRSAEPAAALPLFDDYFKVSPPDDPDLKTARLEHARALKNARRHQESADAFVRLLEEDPLEGAFYSGLAEALYRLRRRDEGRFVEEIYRSVSQTAFEEHVEERLRETGRSAVALGQRGANRTRQRRYLEAFQSYAKAIKLDRTDPRFRSFHADLSIQFRRLSEALAILDDALQAGITPSSGLWWMKGRVFLEREDPRGALSAFHRGVAALAAEGDQGGPDRGQAPVPSIHLSVVRAAIEAGDLASAEAALLRSREAAPGSWEHYFWQGRLDLERGKTEGVAALFTEARQRGGEGLMDLGYWSADLSEKLGNRAEALAALEGIVLSNPGFLPAHERRVALLAGDPERLAPAAEALARLRELRVQIQALERSIDRRPLDVSGADYLELGKLYYRLQDPRAFDLWFLASDLLPRNAEVCRLLLSGMKQSRDVFVRLRFLRRLLDLAPGDASVLGALAEIYTKLHVRLDEAARLAERLHALEPSRSSHRLRGEAALLKGDTARAKSLLEEGLRSFPGDPALAEALSRVSAARPPDEGR
ncbi:MAG TPA: tetratricopeptide repeat protein [Planctomycetota bacterium]|nr:tetratricopeptide repeat protein [Planctomycetota bacterium]